MLRYLAIAVLLVACQPDLTPGKFPAIAADAVGDVAQGDTGTGPTTNNMTGTWALASDWSTCVSLGDKVESRNYTLTRIDMQQTGERLLEKREVCSVVSTPLLGLNTVIPPPVLASGNPIFVQSAVLGTGYAGGVEAQVWGVKMSDPIADPMPNQLTDVRIYDGDNDGKPGVTFHVGTACDLYVAQRALASVQAELQPDGAFIGTAVRSTEQYILGATKGFCQTPFVMTSNNAGNKVRLVRVDKDGMNLDKNGDGVVDCGEIIDAQAAIITWTSVDDTRCNP